MPHCHTPYNLAWNVIAHRLFRGEWSLWNVVTLAQPQSGLKIDKASSENFDHDPSIALWQSVLGGVIFKLAVFLMKMRPSYIFDSANWVQNWTQMFVRDQLNWYQKNSYMHWLIFFMGAVLRFKDPTSCFQDSEKFVEILRFIFMKWIWQVSISFHDLEFQLYEKESPIMWEL